MDLYNLFIFVFFKKECYVFLKFEVYKIKGFKNWKKFFVRLFVFKMENMK